MFLAHCSRTVQIWAVCKSRHRQKNKTTRMVPEWSQTVVLFYFERFNKSLDMKFRLGTWSFGSGHETIGNGTRVSVGVWRNIFLRIPFLRNLCAKWDRKSECFQIFLLQEDRGPRRCFLVKFRLLEKSSEAENSILTSAKMGREIERKSSLFCV